MSNRGKFTVVNGELMHYKYLTKKWENGGWVYTYADSEQDAAEMKKAKDRMAQLQKTREANGAANRRENEAEIAKSKAAEKKTAATQTTKADKSSTTEDRAKTRDESIAAKRDAAYNERQKALAEQKKKENFKKAKQYVNNIMSRMR